MVLLDESGLARSSVRLVSAGPMTRFVEHYWIHDGPYLRARWRIVPDANAYVIFSASNRPGGVETQIFVVGARSRYVDIDVAGRYLTVAARLRAGALPAFTGLRASELTDRSIPLTDLVGRPARDLLDRASTATPDVVQRLIASFLFSRFSGADPASVELGALFSRRLTVAALADEAGLCKRTLHERARGAIGVAPKLALRITRLHRALWLANRRHTWSAAAAGAGYADQAHLTRDMQALLGERPTDWARRARAADSFKTFSKTTR